MCVSKRWIMEHEEDVNDMYEQLCDVLESLNIPDHIVIINYEKLLHELRQWLFNTS